MGWLKRLFGADNEKIALEREPNPATIEAPLHEPPPAAQPAQPAGFGAQQPLVSASGAVAGFEFEMPRRPQQDAHGDSQAEVVSMGARAIGVINAMRPTLDAGRIALATLPAAALLRDAVLEQVPRGTMIAVADLDDLDPQVMAGQRAAIERARTLGVRIGLPASQADLGVPFDFLVARGTSGINAVMVAAQRCRMSQPPAILVASGLASIDEIELALKSGATFASGRVDAMGASAGKRPLQPAVQRICQVLGDLAADADTDRIAQDLQADVTVTYRLLRYVNSSAMGLRNSIDSIPQAVMLLGRKELYRWLSVLMLATSDGRKASRALQEISLARARLLEILAGEQKRDPPDALFTVGLLSLMDVMMQVPLADALEPLRLGPQASEALLEHRGPWHDYLALASDLERRELVSAIDRAEQFGGLLHVMRRAEESWRWAASVQGTSHG